MKEHLTSDLPDVLLHFVKWVDTWKELLIILLMAGEGRGSIAVEGLSPLSVSE